MTKLVVYWWGSATTCISHVYRLEENHSRLEIYLSFTFILNVFSSTTLSSQEKLMPHAQQSVESVEEPGVAQGI